MLDEGKRQLDETLKLYSESNDRRDRLFLRGQLSAYCKLSNIDLYELIKD